LTPDGKRKRGRSRIRRSEFLFLRINPKQNEKGSLLIGNEGKKGEWQMMKKKSSIGKKFSVEIEKKEMKWKSKD